LKWDLQAGGVSANLICICTTNLKLGWFEHDDPYSVRNHPNTYTVLFITRNTKVAETLVEKKQLLIMSDPEQKHNMDY